MELLSEMKNPVKQKYSIQGCGPKERYVKMYACKVFSLYSSLSLSHVMFVLPTCLH